MNKLNNSNITMKGIVKRDADVLPVSIKEVEDKIAVIRNQEVIADADMAFLYGVQTKEVNQAVRNNPDKFPENYMFELTPCELRDLRSKILTTENEEDGYSALERSWFFKVCNL